MDKIFNILHYLLISYKLTNCAPLTLTDCWSCVNPSVVHMLSSVLTSVFGELGNLFRSVYVSPGETWRRVRVTSADCGAKTLAEELWDTMTLTLTISRRSRWTLKEAAWSSMTLTSVGGGDETLA